MPECIQHVCGNERANERSRRFGGGESVSAVFAIKLFIDIISQDDCIERTEYCVRASGKNSITAAQSRDTEIKYDNYYFHFGWHFV